MLGLVRDEFCEAPLPELVWRLFSHRRPPEVYIVEPLATRCRHAILLPALPVNPHTQLLIGRPSLRDISVAVLGLVRDEFCEAPLPELVWGCGRLVQLDHGGTGGAQRVLDEAAHVRVAQLPLQDFGRELQGGAWPAAPSRCRLRGARRVGCWFVRRALQSRRGRSSGRLGCLLLCRVRGGCGSWRSWVVFCGQRQNSAVSGLCFCHLRIVT